VPRREASRCSSRIVSEMRVPTVGLLYSHDRGERDQKGRFRWSFEVKLAETPVDPLLGLVFLPLFALAAGATPCFKGPASVV
jgi:hypothetical protein